DEVIQVCVVLQPSAGELAVGVVHETPEEAERLALVEALRTDRVGELHLEGSGLLVELPDGAIEIGFEQCEHSGRRQPLAERAARLLPRAPKTGAGAALRL